MKLFLFTFDLMINALPYVMVRVGAVSLIIMDGNNPEY
jgi:hypothetical protein